MGEGLKILCIQCIEEKPHWKNAVICTDCVEELRKAKSDLNRANGKWGRYKQRVKELLGLLKSKDEQLASLQEREEHHRNVAAVKGQQCRDVAKERDLYHEKYAREAERKQGLEIRLAGLTTELTEETAERKDAQQERNALIAELQSHGWSIIEISRAINNRKEVQTQ